MSNPDGRVKHDYLFSPVPRSALVAVGDRRIMHCDYVILAVIYNRIQWNAHPDDRRVRITLETLVNLTGWGLTSDYLSKRLRVLRADGWIDYNVKRGAHNPVYEIRPNRHAQGKSEEEIPSDPFTDAGLPDSDPQPSPGRDAAVRGQSEERAASNQGSREAPDETSPRREGSGPSSDQLANDDRPWISATSSRAASPSSPEVLQRDPAVKRDVVTRTPRLGEEGYVTVVSAAKRGGHLTLAETCSLLAAHRLCMRALPVNEAETIAAVQQIGRQVD